jgi:hypothetical protein
MRVLTVLLLAGYCSLPLLAQEQAALLDATTPTGTSSGSTMADLGASAPQDPNGGNSGGQQPAPTHPSATTYSHGYEVRLKIHKYASWATLPLFGTQLALGQSLYDHPETGAKKTAHGIVGAGIVGLFGVNTVTGVWNLWEGRHDTDGRRMRIIHSVLMLASDGGFVAATATGPDIHNGIIRNPSDRSLHRNIAVASIGVGTVGYLLMLLKGR